MRNYSEFFHDSVPCFSEFTINLKVLSVLSEIEMHRVSVSPSFVVEADSRYYALTIDLKSVEGVKELFYFWLNVLRGGSE